MKYFFISIAVFFLSGCQTATTPEKTIVFSDPKPTDVLVADTATLIQKEIESENSNDEGENIYNDYETYYIVVADTHINYAALYDKMFILSKKLKLPIDTMERSYNPSKNLIALPEDDEDEMYAGEYYPRRSPTKNLSLEYLNFYNPAADQKTIALVAGIYEKKHSADSALMILKQVEKKAFHFKGNVYVGCMH